MQADAKHINSEPGQTEHDLAKDAHRRKSAFANEATPAGVKNDGVSQYDRKRSVLLWVPSPESVWLIEKFRFGERQVTLVWAPVIGLLDALVAEATRLLRVRELLDSRFAPV